MSIYPHFTLAATPADQLEKAMMEGYMIAEGRRVEESEYVADSEVSGFFR